MTDLVQRLNEPEDYYPGNFDTVKRANAMLSCLCQEAADALVAKDNEIATMRYENAIRFGTSHPEMYKTELDGAKDEIARLNTEYQEVCRLVAQMHLAAVGGVVGPKLGVIEDVKALKESHDKYKALCDQMGDALEVSCSQFPNHLIQVAKALTAWKEIK